MIDVDDYTVANIFSETSRHPKVIKNGIVHDAYTLILHLAPAKSSGYEVCPMRSAGCTEACLNTAGHHWKNADGSDRKQTARVNRTKLFFHDREGFMRRMAREIDNKRKYAANRGYLFGVRLNGTSDIPFENYPVIGFDNGFSTNQRNIMETFPEVQFYDYTKRFNRKNIPANYHLTFSRAEDNEHRCPAALKNGMNVAVVFRRELPATFWGLPVVDGDLSDWRPADNENHAGRVIVGLRAKGKAKYDETGFVI